MLKSFFISMLLQLNGHSRMHGAKKSIQISLKKSNPFNNRSCQQKNIPDKSDVTCKSIP